MRSSTVTILGLTRLMKPLCLLPFLIGISLLDILKVKAGEPSGHTAPTNSFEVIIGRMSVRSGSATMTFLDLHRAGQNRLHQKYKEFRTEYEAVAQESSLPTIQVDVNQNEKFVSLVYKAINSNRAWFVNFSKAGRITSDSEGVSVAR